MRKNAAAIATLQKMQVPPASHGRQTVFDFATWLTCGDRDALSRTALEQAVRLSPPFAPAYTQLVEQIWFRPDWDDHAEDRRLRSI